MLGIYIFKVRYTISYMGEGWLTNFKERNNLKNYKWHGKAGSANSATVENKRSHIQQLIITEHGY